MNTLHNTLRFAVPLAALFSLLFLGGAAVPNDAPLPYDPLAMLHPEVARQEVELHDPARSRDVLLTVRFPEGEGRRHLPLVIFSHGAGGSGDAFIRLSATLAARGFVVVHPWHSDSAALRARRGEAPMEPGRGAAQLIDRVDAADRLADVRFILAQREAIGSALGNPELIDPRRVGLAGHSAGAMVTQIAAGMRSFPPRGDGAGISTPIAEIAAFAVISGQGVGSTLGALRRTEASWAECTRPMLVVTGSLDASPLTNETPETRTHPFVYAPETGHTYLLFIEGATHSAFQGPARRRWRGESNPPNARWMEDVTTAAVVALMEAWVTDQPAARRWLNEGGVNEIPGGTLQWRRKAAAAPSAASP